MRTWDNGTANTSPPTPGSYLSDWAMLTQNYGTAGTTTGAQIIRDQIRYLATKYYFNEKSYTTTTTAQTQAYALPPDFEMMENVTVSTGGYLWSGTPTADRAMFDRLNLIPYYSDFLQYVFIWNGQLNLWPIPASSSNTITMNYKSRVVDPSQQDVTTGTVSVANGSTTVTGVGTSFASWMGQSGWIRISHTTGVTAANGDNRWYQIASVASATSLTLSAPYQGATVAGGAFTVGDVPILPEDYQDIPLYWALMTYYTTINPKPEQAKLYDAMYKERIEYLDNKYGSKDYSPVLTDTQAKVYNPNLFQQSIS